MIVDCRRGLVSCFSDRIDFICYLENINSLVRNKRKFIFECYIDWVGLVLINVSRIGRLFFEDSFWIGLGIWFSRGGKRGIRIVFFDRILCWRDIFNGSFSFVFFKEIGGMVCRFSCFEMLFIVLVFWFFVFIRVLIYMI